MSASFEAHPEVVGATWCCLCLFWIMRALERVAKAHERQADSLEFRNRAEEAERTREREGFYFPPTGRP